MKRYHDSYIYLKKKIVTYEDDISDKALTLVRQRKMRPIITRMGRLDLPRLNFPEIIMLGDMHDDHNTASNIR